MESSQRGVCTQCEFCPRPVSSGQAPRVLSTADGDSVLEALRGRPSGCSTSETGLAGVEELGWQGQPRLPHLPLQTFPRVVAKPPALRPHRTTVRDLPSLPPSLPRSAALLLVCVGVGPAQRPRGPGGGTLSRGGHGRVVNVKTLKPFRHLDLKLGGIASTGGI